MKFPYWAAIFLLLAGLTACQNLKKQSKEGSEAAAAAENPKSLPYWKAAHVIEGNNPDTAATYQVQKAPDMVDVPMYLLPEASASRKAYLSTGWWHLNMAFEPSDTLVHLNYQQKWLKFREDQTFDIMIHGKVVSSGRWNWDEQKNEIYLSCNDPYINNTWKVIDRGYVMIWKGNTEVNVTGIQVRVANSRTAPPVE